MQNLRKGNRAIGTNLSVGLARLDCSEPTTGAPRLNLSPTTPHAHQPRIILSLFYFGVFFVPLSLTIGPALAVALQGCCPGLNDMTPECGDTNFVKACWSFYSTPGLKQLLMLLNLPKVAVSCRELWKPSPRIRINGSVNYSNCVIKACQPSIAEFQHPIGDPLLLWICDEQGVPEKSLK